MFGPISLLFDTCFDLGCGIHFQTILDRYGVDVQNLGSALQRIWYMFVTISIPYRDCLRLFFLSVCFSFCFMSFIITHFSTLKKTLQPHNTETITFLVCLLTLQFSGISQVISQRKELTKRLCIFLRGYPPWYFLLAFEYL